MPAAPEQSPSCHPRSEISSFGSHLESRRLGIGDKLLTGRRVGVVVESGIIWQFPPRRVSTGPVAKPGYGAGLLSLRPGVRIPPGPLNPETPARPLPTKPPPLCPPARASPHGPPRPARHAHRVTTAEFEAAQGRDRARSVTEAYRAGLARLSEGPSRGRRGATSAGPPTPSRPTMLARSRTRASSPFNARYLDASEAEQPLARGTPSSAS